MLIIYRVANVWHGNRGCSRPNQQAFSQSILRKIWSGIMPAGMALICCVRLRQLGLEVSPEREEAVKTTLRNRLEQKRKSQEELFCTDISCDSDATFAFIAGYTSGGAPYGVTWDEMEDADGEMK